MTQGSIKEYAEAVRERYFPASKKEKDRILDEFTKAKHLSKLMKNQSL